jgi:FMN phosphatase YigB (HAD superfamily)
VRPGIEEVLSLGIPCAVLSDYDPAPKLAAMGLAGRFAAALWAGDARLRALKPYPKGLRLLLAEFGAEAERALFIGDRDEVDGAAARAAGMDYAQIGAAGFGALTRRIVTQYAQ